ncbi:MAG: CAP domain-containing protein [Nostoc sp. LLA-1]|nr:CAP domain-containing protein [Cyanocohniella sp. LLY]
MIQNTIASITVGTLVFASGAIAISAPSQTSLSSDRLLVAQSSTINITALEASVFKQINDYRASKNLPLLTRNSAINNQAKIHSQNMASGAVSFGHSGFSQRIKATRLNYIAAAENVAYNQGFSDPATKAVEGWLKSSEHLVNIKGNYNVTGIGVASNSRGEIYFTQIFQKL